MSIIVKCTPNLSASGGGKGFPPGEVNIIDIKTVTPDLYIKWSDPDNTVLNDSTIVSWAGTILIRNTNHYPESIEDGVVVCDNNTKNKYNNDWFIDKDLTVDTTYYYRFFTYSSDKVYNTDTNMTFSRIMRSFNSVFSENTLEQISTASQFDIIPDSWKIGDSVNINLPGDPNLGGTDIERTYTFQIWDFNRFDKSDGSGKAGIVLGCSTALYSLSDYADSSDYANSYGYPRSYIKQKLDRIYNAMPEETRKYIIQVNVPCAMQNSTLKISSEYIFIPGVRDLTEDIIPQYELNGVAKCPIFTDNASRIRLRISHTGSVQYWTRDRFGYPGTTVTEFYMCNSKGEVITMANSWYNSYGVVPVFCI